MSENSLNDTSNYQLEFPVNGKEMIDATLYRRNVKKIDRLVKMEAEDRAEADTALGDKISVIAGHIGEPYSNALSIGSRLGLIDTAIEELRNSVKSIEERLQTLGEEIASLDARVSELEPLGPEVE